MSRSAAFGFESPALRKKKVSAPIPPVCSSAPLPPVRSIVAVAAVQLVVALVAEDRVVARPGEQHVVLVGAVEHVVLIEDLRRRLVEHVVLRVGPEVRDVVVDVDDPEQELVLGDYLDLVDRPALELLGLQQEVALEADLLFSDRVVDALRATRW